MSNNTHGTQEDVGGNDDVEYESLEGALNAQSMRNTTQKRVAVLKEEIPTRRKCGEKYACIQRRLIKNYNWKL